MLKSSEEILASYVDALHPIIYINHFDSYVVDKTILNISDGSKVVEFNNALGIIDFKTKSPIYECDLNTCLKTIRDDGYDDDLLIVLKDIHDSLSNAETIALLKRIAEDNLYREQYQATIFIVDSKVVIPREIENYITIFDYPVPTQQEILTIIQDFIKDLKIEVDEGIIGEMSLSFKGLYEFQIKQILNLAYQDGGLIDEDDLQLILKERLCHNKWLIFDEK